MTEANDDGSSSLVRVCAQVMKRDDSTGGWVPMGGGGLSNVSVCKRDVIVADRDKCRHEYLIYGKRISDQAVVLSCTIKKDFEYNKVMPTFHHWRTGDHKFGLTFQTAADARTFDKGVRDAVDELLDGMNKIPWLYNRRLDAEDEVFMAVNLPVDRDGSLSSSGSATTCSNSSRHTPTVATPDHGHHHHHTTSVAPPAITTPDPPACPHVNQLHHHRHHHSGGSNTPVGIATTNISPASTLSTPPAVVAAGCHQPPFVAAKNHYSRKTKPPPPKPSPGGGTAADRTTTDGEEKTLETYSYVQLSKGHHPPAPPATQNEYSLPMVEALRCGDRRDSIASIKKQKQFEMVAAFDSQQAASAAAAGGKRLKRKGRRGGGGGGNNHRKPPKARCKYCSDFFAEDKNPRGGCEYSPDYVRSTIDKVSCISCAHCLLYHCMSNAEGEFPRPCACTCAHPEHEDEPCGGKWFGMALLSLVVPCLWCYLPMRACHRCAVACHVCGGRHEAS